MDTKRVIGVVPIVLDAINFVAVEHHQFRSYGGYHSIIIVIFNDAIVAIRTPFVRIIDVAYRMDIRAF